MGPINDSDGRAVRVESISAVTLPTGDMARAVRFYRSLGFMLDHGGEEAAFTTFRVGGHFLNLRARTEDEAGQAAASWPGRVIFHVSNVDAMHRRAVEEGHQPEASPRNAEWGERYFHLDDPDGHRLSFARPLGRGRPPP